MSEENFGRLVVLLIGIAWSVVFYLGKRTLTAIDKKIEASFERIDRAHSSLKESMRRGEKRMRHSGKAMQKLFLTRQEFGAYIANINHKINSIYKTVNKTGADRQ